MESKSPLHMIAGILVIIGALNWGLVGLGMLINVPVLAGGLVKLLLGWMPVLEAIVYLVVGLAAVVYIPAAMKQCGMCEKK